MDGVGTGQLAPRWYLARQPLRTGVRFAKAPTGFHLASDQCRHFRRRQRCDALLHRHQRSLCTAARTRTEEDQGDGNRGSLIAH